MTTDERLRRGAREAARSGAEADHARLLIERVRAGLLSEERLALAAALGHPLACSALGRAPRPADDLPAALARLDLGAEARARVALAASRLAQKESPSRPGPSDELPRVQARVTEWVRSGGRTALPVEPRRFLVNVSFSRGVPAAYRTCYLDGENLPRHLARAVRDAAGAQDDMLRALNGARRWATGEVAALARSRGDWTEWWSEAGPAAARVVAEALRREVAPWAAGEADPLQG